MGDAIGRIRGPLPDAVLILAAIVLEATVEVNELVEIVFAFITVEIEVIVGERFITGGSSPKSGCRYQSKTAGRTHQRPEARAVHAHSVGRRKR